MIRDLSLGELQTMATKAAVGGGRAHGLAQEAGYAVRWLAQRGYDGAGALAALLQATDGDNVILHLPDHSDDLVSQNRALCPLVMATFISDLGRVPRSIPDPIYAPVLMAPILSPGVNAGALQVSFANHPPLTLGRDGALSGPDPGIGPFEVSLNQSDKGLASAPLSSRAHVSERDIATLSMFAARTYAPATDESRAKGAGAGLSDQD